jgi:hypothetical protein
MKKVLILLFVSMLVMLSSCSENCDCVQPGDTAIIGMWERTATDLEGLSFDVYLVFEENGNYAFLLAEPAEGHTNSYANYSVSGNNLTILNDSDCGEDGVYQYSIAGEELTLTATNENCDPRKLMLEGLWSRTF